MLRKGTVWFCPPKIILKKSTSFVSLKIWLIDRENFCDVFYNTHTIHKVYKRSTQNFI